MLNKTSQFANYLNSLNKKTLRESSLSELIKNSKVNISKTNAANVLARPQFKQIRPGREVGLDMKNLLENLLKNKTGRMDSVEVEGKKYYKGSDGRIREIQPNTEERIQKRRERNRLYTEKRIAEQGVFPLGGDNVKKNLWYHLYRSSDATRPEGTYTRLKIDPKTNRSFWNTKDAYNVAFIDTGNKNKKITFKNLENYINNNFGENYYDELVEPYKIKNFINKQTINVGGKPVSLRYELRKRLLDPNVQLNPRAAAYEVHHPFGMTKNPFITQLSFRDANGREFFLKDKMLRNFKNAETFGEKRNIFKNFLSAIEELPGSIQTAPGKKIYGKKVNPEDFIQELGEKSKLGRQFRPILKNLTKSKYALLGLAGLGSINAAPSQAATTAMQDQVAEGQTPEIKLAAPIKYDYYAGFVKPEDPNQKASQSDLLYWIADNEVKEEVKDVGKIIGEAAAVIGGATVGLGLPDVKKTIEEAKLAGKSPTKSILGKGFYRLGSPLATAAFTVPQALDEDVSLTEMATDPLNYLGLATMETLGKRAGTIAAPAAAAQASGILGTLKNYASLKNVGEAVPGKLNAALRLGLSPRVIAGASRFLGIPGLIASTGYSLYDYLSNKDESLTPSSSLELPDTSKLGI
jgi:hypothetical protein